MHFCTHCGLAPLAWGRVLHEVRGEGGRSRNPITSFFYRARNGAWRQWGLCRQSITNSGSFPCPRARGFAAV
jgi:hypothetical protein